ncbi:isoprenyl transferase [Mucilaginibacter ginkgonis]|uniref:Isoprenyl transferase n=1 Tax=Mucilaginibacter ginkgonis TaxID=2682091 RepID=A0A6I4I0N9_9SPHI|nr:isoprenyl transferase [Mucilaginibacter ginkgonis]QQL48477.1 isoprenyl transferase [Mucilaginibacter ginkgonis]
MDYLEQIDKTRVPQHVAIIMDGNGRWAKSKGKLRVFGHHNGISSVSEAVEAADDAGVKFLTLYTFSSENWNRPKYEVNAIMELIVSALTKELPNMMTNNVRMLMIGDAGMLPKRSIKELNNAISKTASNTGLTLVLAISYSSRDEILMATKRIAAKAESGELKADDITDAVFSENLYTSEIPDPELLIRTSGEYRISNFLLWQIAYAELYFTPKLWPDFKREDFFEALLDYQKRERRFGKTSEQVN